MNEKINNPVIKCPICNSNINNKINKETEYEIIENGELKKVCYKCYKLVMEEDYWA